MLGAGSLGKSSRVCSVLCVRFRSSVETNKATADTRCTEPPHGASSTPCDRLGRDMLEDLGSALYRRLKKLGSGGQARSPTPTYKKMLVLWLRLPCVVWASARAARWPRHLPEAREQGRWRGSARDVDVLSRLVVVSARRATTTSRPPPWVDVLTYNVIRPDASVSLILQPLLYLPYNAIRHDASVSLILQPLLHLPYNVIRHDASVSLIL